MNICIIAPRYPYKDNMEFVFVKKLVEEWAKMGHSCVVVAFFPLTTYIRGRISFKPRYYQYEIPAGNDVQVYHPRTIALGSLSIKGVSINSWIDSKIFNRLMKKTGVPFDFIYCHFFSSALNAYKYAISTNIPFFVATGESDIPRLDKPYQQFTFKDFRDYTNGVIAVSSKNKIEAADRGLIDPEKCQVFPNGTDLALFHSMDRQTCRERLNLPQDVFIVSCVGYICERKGQNRLLEAVRKLGDKNIKLIFLGRSAKTETFPLEGEEILFKGSIENKDIPTYLCASDVFCLPTRAEGCCNAVIEALACGLPVISSNLPFNWDVLDENNSIMIDPDSVNEIAAAIHLVYIDTEMRKKLSNGAIEKATRLDIHQRAEGILSFIEQRINK